MLESELCLQSSELSVTVLHPSFIAEEGSGSWDWLFPHMCASLDSYVFQCLMLILTNSL